MVSSSVDKDVVLVNDEEREVVDQPSKGLPSIPTIIISGLTHAETFDPKPAEGTLLQADDDNDDDVDVDFGDLSAFDEILVASFAVLSKETPLASGSEPHKSQGGPSSSVLISTPIPSTPAPLSEIPVTLLGSISTLLNHPLDSLAVDGENKQALIDAISSLSKATLPSTIQPLHHSLCRFVEDLLEQVLKVDAAETSLAQASHQLEIFDKELEGSMKAKNAASSKLAAGEARV